MLHSVAGFLCEVSPSCVREAAGCCCSLSKVLPLEEVKLLYSAIKCLEELWLQRDGH